MTIVTVGIDLAKNVFAVHGVDAAGKPALVRPSVPRSKLLEFIASLPPCLIGMEACSGGWAWYPVNTALAARSVWGASKSPGTRTCAAWPNAVATGAR